MIQIRSSYNLWLILFVEDQSDRDGAVRDSLGVDADWYLSTGGLYLNDQFQRFWVGNVFLVHPAVFFFRLTFLGEVGK